MARIPLQDTNQSQQSRDRILLQELQQQSRVYLRKRQATPEKLRLAIDELRKRLGLVEEMTLDHD